MRCEVCSVRVLFRGFTCSWYRPPELLFGANHYCEKVDLWSVGCVFAEMVLRVPLFRGYGKDAESERLNQLAHIFRLTGTPDPASWKGVTLLPRFVEFSPKKPESMRSIFADLSAEGVDLLERCVPGRMRPP